MSETDLCWVFFAIVGAVGCDRVGAVLAAGRADACGPALDRSADDRGAHGAPVQAWMHHKPYHERYEFVPLSQISPDLQHAVIAAEDARFYQHHGFDWHADGNRRRRTIWMAGAFAAVRRSRSNW